jgi:hypothetical protein
MAGPKGTSKSQVGVSSAAVYSRRSPLLAAPVIHAQGAVHARGRLSGGPLDPR